jgi:hypothetical protein
VLEWLEDVQEGEIAILVSGFYDSVKVPDGLMIVKDNA